MRATGLRVHVQPRSARSEVVGVLGNHLKIRIKAPPVAGAANQELQRFLAGRLQVPRSQLRVAAGAGGRRKLIRFDEPVEMPAEWAPAAVPEPPEAG